MAITTPPQSPTSEVPPIDDLTTSPPDSPHNIYDDQIGGGITREAPVSPSSFGSVTAPSLPGKKTRHLSTSAMIKKATRLVRSRYGKYNPLPRVSNPPPPNAALNPSLFRGMTQHRLDFLAGLPARVTAFHDKYEVQRPTHTPNQVTIFAKAPFMTYKNNPKIHDNLKRCATLAIGEYNLKEHTNYRFVDIENVKWEPDSGLKYYITFQAMSSATKELDTFEAMVYASKVERWVMGFQIKKPQSTWHLSYDMKHLHLVF